MPPEGDEEVHGHEHQLPEGVKQHQIQGQKYAHDAGLGRQDEKGEGGPVMIDGVPGNQDADQAEQGRQDGEPEADPVHDQQVLNTDGRNPFHAFHIQNIALDLFQEEGQHDDEGKFGGGEEKRAPARPGGTTAGADHDQEAACQR